MPNPAAAALIADHLPRGLIHPGDGDKQPPKMIPLPGLSNLGITPEQAAHFAQQAGLPANDAPKLIGEAIVHLLETEGLELIDRGELERLRAEVATPQQVDPGAPRIDVHCRCNHERALMQVPMGGRGRITISGAVLRAHIDDVCGCS